MRCRLSTVGHRKVVLGLNELLAFYRFRSNVPLAVQRSCSSAYFGLDMVARSGGDVLVHTLRNLVQLNGKSGSSNLRTDLRIATFTTEPHEVT